MNKRRVIFVACLFFIFGVGVTSIFFEHLNSFSFYIFILFVLSLISSFYFYPTSSANGRRKIFIIALWGAFLFLGIWRVFVAVPENTPLKIWHYNDSEIVFIGEVVKEPDVRSSNQKLTVNVNKNNLSGRVLVTTSIYPEYEYGDILEIKCKLKKPEKFEDFAYDKYLARYDIYSICYSRQINRLEKSDSFLKNIYRFKNKLSGVINRGLSEPEASLANAMALGMKRDIPDDLRDTFSKVGLSHIVAISGMHIGIMVAILFGLFLNLGFKRKYIFYLVTCFLVLYVFLIGMPASAFRASLMGFLVLLAMHIGRLNRLDYALVLVGTILLLINPKQLTADVGFQLSFLAVLGIVYLYPVFNKFYQKFEPKKFKKMFKIIFDMLAVTISAQVFTMPIIIYNFKTISLISPISNLLVLWALPFILISIFIGIILSLIVPSISVLFFLPANLLLKYLVFIANFLENIPFSFFLFK